MSDKPINEWREGDRYYHEGVERTGPVQNKAFIGEVAGKEYRRSKYLRILQPGEFVPVGATLLWIAGPYTGDKWEPWNLYPNGFEVLGSQRNMLALVSMPKPVKPAAYTGRLSRTNPLYERHKEAMECGACGAKAREDCAPDCPAWESEPDLSTTPDPVEPEQCTECEAAPSGFCGLCESVKLEPQPDVEEALRRIKASEDALRPSFGRRHHPVWMHLAAARAALEGRA